MARAVRFRLTWTPLLRRRGGKWLQAVGLICPAAWSPDLELALTAGSRRHSARLGDLLTFDGPPGEWMGGGEAAYLW
ncbi:MAG: hypothetical protein HRF43_13050, partial [Phycisphaerae bacterium]